MEYGFVSLLVPLVVIGWALYSRDVVVSLFLGIVIGFIIIHPLDPLGVATMVAQALIDTLTQGWVAKTLLFSLLVGAIMALMEKSGAIASFIAYLEHRYKRINSPIGAQMVAFIIGVVIFIESSITALISGAVAKPLCDKNGVSREKLAYICDATSAPICSLIPLNGWGALLLGLILAAIEAGKIEGSSVALLLSSIPFNFYAWAALGVALYAIVTSWHIGEMAHMQPRTPDQLIQSTAKPSLSGVLIPILSLMVGVVGGLYLTGDGSIMQGSGSTSVYYATLLTLGVMYVLYRWQKRLKHEIFMQTLFEGMGKMVPIVAILLLALTIGSVIEKLGTAQYIASILSESLPKAVVPVVIFWVASLTAFATGTSWGTFSIMMPIALSLAVATHTPIPLAIGAVISGGIFGDHASPISDTTIISSLAAQCDPIDHALTQLPYALIGGAIASVAFLITGAIL